MPDNRFLPEGYVTRYDIYTGAPYTAKLDPVTGEAVPAPLPEVPAAPAPPPAPVCEPTIQESAAPVGASPGPGLRYAGFLPRLAAYAADALLIAVFCGGVRLIGLLTAGELLSAPVFFAFTAADILGYLLAKTYFILFTKCCGATPGKMLLRLRVVGADGAPPSWWAVIYRETVGRYLSSLWNIGYLVLAFHRQHCGFHDMLADTRVCLD